MDLDETWHVGLRSEKTERCTFPAKSRHGFRRDREKMGRRHVFLSRERPNTFATFLGSISAKLQTSHEHVSVVARDTLFHIPEKFPLRGRISWKPVFLRAKGYPVCGKATGHGKRSATPKLFVSPRGRPVDLSFLGDFCWWMYRFPAIHVRISSKSSFMASRIVI